MNPFNLFKTPDINEGMKKMKNTRGAVLIDVRTREEYSKAHIPGSLNIPLDELQTAESKIFDKNTPLFVHCLSGGRSRQAVHFLKNSGYSDVTDLGGISYYSGEIEKGA